MSFHGREPRRALIQNWRGSRVATSGQWSRQRAGCSGALVCSFSGLVQIRRFSGNSTDDERVPARRDSQGSAPTTVSGAAAEGVAEHLQPMRVRLPSQELGRGLTLALGAIAALQPAVVEVELEQGQI